MEAGLRGTRMRYDMRHVQFSAVQLDLAEERRRKDAREGGLMRIYISSTVRQTDRQTDAVLCCAVYKYVYCIKGTIRWEIHETFSFPRVHLRICIERGIYLHHRLKTEPVHVIIQPAS
jgi:hypothetical protein